MLARVSAVATLLLLAPSSAGAAGSLTSLPSPGSFPYSDGSQVVWSGGSGTVRSLDPVSGRLRNVAVDAGCALTAAGPGAQVIACPLTPTTAARVYVIDVRSGARSPVAAVAQPDAIGKNWLRAPGGSSCYHCDGQNYVNWRTGERHFVNNLDDLPIDLDAAKFRRIPLTIGGLYGLTEATARGPRALMAGFALEPKDQAAVILKTSTDRLLGHCRISCDAPLLTARSAYWVEEGSRTTNVRSVSLKTGRKRSWLLPRARADSFRLLGTSTAVLVMQRRNSGRSLPRLSRLNSDPDPASR